MKVAAVIVTFNRKDLLIKVVEAVIENEVSHIYIVDNNSSDGTDNVLLKYVENHNLTNLITYKKLEENTGGAGGFHEGIKIASETKIYDWLWLMDDDICPEKDTLEQYKKFILKNKNDIGAVMGLRFFEKKEFSFESKEHNFSRFNKYFKQNMVNQTDLEKEYLTIADFPFEGPMINTNIIKKIGYPNKDFFIIGDDTDYAIRISKISKIYMVTGAKFNRLLSPYVNQENYVFNWKEYYTLRNMTHLNLVYGENFSVKYLRNIRALFGNFKKNITIVIKNKDVKELYKLKYIWQAFYHGMTGKLGKTYVPGDF